MCPTFIQYLLNRTTCTFAFIAGQKMCPIMDPMLGQKVPTLDGPFDSGKRKKNSITGYDFRHSCHGHTIFQVFMRPPFESVGLIVRPLLNGILKGLSLMRDPIFSIRIQPTLLNVLTQMFADRCFCRKFIFLNCFVLSLICPTFLVTNVFIININVIIADNG